MRHNRNVLRVVDLLGLLHKAPRTVAELVELTGMNEELVLRWVHALRAEGLIVNAGLQEVWSVTANRHYFHNVYAWSKQ